MTNPRVTLKIENFGPIVEGTVEFKPLTFLIGANNSGKTYVATLLYALSRALNGATSLPIQNWNDDLAVVEQFVAEHLQSEADWFQVDAFPPSLLRAIESYLLSLTDRTSQSVDETIRQYFSVTKLSDLVRHDAEGSASLHIESTGLTAGRPFVSIDVSEAITRVEVDRTVPSRMEAPEPSYLLGMLRRPNLLPLELSLDLWTSMVRSAGYGRFQSYYLPAARSGILDSWPLFATLAVRNLSRAIVRGETEIAPFSGVVGEFLQIVIARFLPSSDQNGHEADRSALRPAIDLLEGELLGGRVVIDENRPGADQLLFQTEALQVPLQRASSMVTELAAIDLLVREVLDPNDLLIIDEPESHLHPENQRLIARVLVRLANAGVNLVAPTHSSTILHQVSNMLLASTLDEASRAKFGYVEADLISADDVAVYVFEQREDGTHIVPVAIEPGFGISEDEFLRVAEAIGDESFRLSFVQAHQPA